VKSRVPHFGMELPAFGWRWGSWTPRTAGRILQTPFG
jgi:hypothetical protein